MLLEGIFPPVTTPFRPDGRVYFHKIETNMERFSRTPVAGLTVLGSTGEAVMLSDEEQRDVLKAARESTAAEKVLIAGTGHESARETLAFTAYAASLGYDVALVRTPHYYRPQMRTANLVAFYKYVADRSPLPVLLYSVPVFTGYDLPVEAVIELAGHPNIVGIKESSGNVEKIAAMVSGTKQHRRSVNVTEVFQAVTGRMLQPSASPELVSAAQLRNGSAVVAVEAPPSNRPSFKMRTKEVGFQVLAGSAQSLLWSLEAGARGAVLAFATPAPTACYEIYTASKEGDATLATEKQQRIAKADGLMGELGIAAIKYAMDLNGYYGGSGRLPLLPLTGEQRSEVEAVMGDIRH